MDKDEDGRYSRLVEWFYYHVLYRSYGCSQLLKNQLSLMKIFVSIHFSDLFAKNPAVMRDQKEVGRLTAEFYDCYTQYLK